MAEGADLDTGEGATEESPPSTETEVSTEVSTEDSSAEPEAKEPKGVQKRINELTANWREEQRRANSLQDQNFELQRQAFKPEAPKVEVKEGEPKLDDYASYEDYGDARVDYRADRKFEEWQEKQQEGQRAQVRQDNIDAFQAKAEPFRLEHPDFEAVITPVLLTEAMTEVIDTSDKGPELLYKLGQNPAEAARIAALPPIRAAIEMGNIEYQLGVLQPNTETSAPDVIEPIGGGPGVSQSTDPEKMTVPEWNVWRQSQLNKDS